MEDFAARAIQRAIHVSSLLSHTLRSCLPEKADGLPEKLDILRRPVFARA